MLHRPPNPFSSRRARVFAGLALLLVVLSGCTRGTQGIFATIEVEEATDTSNLPDAVSPTALVYTDISDSGGRYLVLANGRIWQRDGVDGSSWSGLATPASRRAKFMAGLDTDADGVSEEAYAVFDDGDGNGTLLYTLQAGGGGEGDLSWSAVSTILSAGESITGMRGIGDRVLASTSSSSGDSLISWGTNGTAEEDHGTFADGGLRDAARASGNQVVAVGRTTLVGVVADITSTTSPGKDVVTDSAAIVNAYGVGLIQDASNNELFAVATLDGDVYVQTPTDAAAPTSDAFVQASGSIDSRAFSDIARIESVTGEERVAVSVFDPAGSLSEIADGYREAEVTGTGTGITLDFTSDIGDSYRGSDLARTGIGFMEYISGSDTLFALTVGTGLWRTTYPSTGANPDWNWE